MDSSLEERFFVPTLRVQVIGRLREHQARQKKREHNELSQQQDITSEESLNSSIEKPSKDSVVAGVNN